MKWKIKRFSNDALREKFINATVPQAEFLGLTIPDPDLKWDEARGTYAHGDSDWDEFWRVVKGDGSVDTRQITINVEAAPQAPAIQRFTVDPHNQITLGQCVDVRWNVSGDVSRVQIAANGNSLWDNAPVKGQIQDCPSSPGNVAYGIEARGSGGVSRGHQNVNVVGQATATPAPPPPSDHPVIHAFSVQPDQIGAGGCADLRWQTGGGTSWVNIWRGEYMVWENAPLSGQVQDCPEGRGTLKYRLIAYNPQDKRLHQDQFVTVQ